MKKLFTSLAFVSLALFTTECKVSNVEPVGEVIENSDGDKLTLYSKPQLKPNVKVLDTLSSQKIEIIGGNVLRIKGKVNFSNRRIDMGLRVSADENDIKIGDLLIATASGKYKGLILEITGIGQELITPSGLETDYKFTLRSELTDIFESLDFSAEAKVVYPKRLSVTVKGSVEPDGSPISASAELDVNIDNSFALTSTTTFRVLQGRFIEASFKTKIANTFRTTFTLKGNVTLKGEKEIEIPPKTVTFLIGEVPVILVIVPAAKMSVELSGGFDISSKEQIVLPIVGEFEAGFRGRGRITPKMKFTKTPTLSASQFKSDLNGKLKVAFEFGPEIYLYTKAFVGMGGKLEAFVGLEFGCNNSDLSATPFGGVLPKLEFLFPVLKTFGIEDAMITFSPKEEDVTLKGSPVSLISNFCETEEVTGPSNPSDPSKPPTQPKPPTIPIGQCVPNSLLLTFGNHGMVLYEGSSPPSINGRFLISPKMLVTSSLPNDVEKSTYGNLEISLTNLNNALKMESKQFDMLGNLLSQDVSSCIKVVGRENNFTIYADVNGLSNAINYKNYIVISGKLTATGIENLYYSLYVVSKGSDPQEFLLPAKNWRIYKDSDGLAKKQ